MRKPAFAENTPTAPNGFGKPAKAGFSRVSWVVKSRLLPAWAEPAGFGQKRPILPKGGLNPAETARRAVEGRFLDAKRGFLTVFVELLSVLFGDRIRVLEDPDRDVFRDTFLSRLGQNPHVLPFEPARTVPESDINRPEKWPVLSLFVIYWTEKPSFGHLLVTFSSRNPIQAAPLITLRRKCLHFRRHFLSFPPEKDSAGSLIKPT